MLENIRGLLLGKAAVKEKTPELPAELTRAELSRELEVLAARELEQAVAPCRKLGLAVEGQLREVEASLLAIEELQINEKATWRQAIEVHRKRFLERARSSLQAAKALRFDGSYGELEKAAKELERQIIAITKAASDNRYLYTFFPEEMNRFNQAMKPLVASSDALSKELAKKSGVLEEKKLVEELARKLAEAENKLAEAAREAAGLEDNAELLKAIAEAKDRVPQAEAETELARNIAETGEEASALNAEWRNISRELEKLVHGRESPADEALLDKVRRFLKTHENGPPAEDKEGFHSLLARLEARTAADRKQALKEVWRRAETLFGEWEETRKRSGEQQALKAQYARLREDAGNLEEHLKERKTALEKNLKGQEALAAEIAAAEKEIAAKASAFLGRQVALRRTPRQ